MLVNSMDNVGRSDVVRKALLMLELMDRSEEDHLVFGYVSSMLVDYDEKKADTEQLLCSLISLLLSSFSTHLAPDDVLSTQIKMLQMLLVSPLTSAEHLALRQYVETSADLITQTNDVSSPEVGSTLEPLLHSFRINNKEPSSKKENVPPQTVIDNPSGDGSKQNYWNMDMSELGKSLQELFSSNYLGSSLEQSEKFGVLLEGELAALKHIDDDELFETRKSYVLAEMEKVLHSHQKMTAHFQKMSEFIAVVQKDSARLNEELDRVTSLSLTDELTELPNRRAFLRRLKDEVGRVKRYGHHLSFAMIDLDYFKPINDKYGHHAGDSVLKAYSAEVLSMFREQDMVARYGGEEFVVIFPNTTIPGALQALNMVQGRAESAVLRFNDETISLPTFSAGLISFQAGESIESFVHRADQALYDAKKKGRNRIEVKLQIEELT